MQKQDRVPYWGMSSAEALERFGSSQAGLTSAEAETRLKAHGENTLKAQQNVAPVLLYSTVGIAAVTLLLPYLGLSSFLNITAIPPWILLALIGIAVLYILITEVAKHFFFRSSRPAVKKASRA